MNQPTLLNSCARAATAAEARFRIPIAPVVARSTRVIALDDRSAELIATIADEPWRGAHFLRYDSSDGDVAPNGEVIDVQLRTATDGTACTLRGIMSAAVVVANGASVEAAVSALRPHSRVLLVSDDQDDISEILSAVGA